MGSSLAAAMDPPDIGGVAAQFGTVPAVTTPESLPQALGDSSSVGFLALVNQSTTNRLGYALLATVNLYGTVEFDKVLSPDEELWYVPEDPPASLASLQASLQDRQPVESLLPPSPKVRPTINPLWDHAQRAGAMLLASGNGVFFNIRTRQMARDNLMANLKDPLGRIAYGWSYDSDSFNTNFVKHPVLWYSYATYLKGKGASDMQTMVITQIANLLWEGVMEGAYVPPSGVDLLTDFLSCAAGVYLYNKGPGKRWANVMLKAEKWFADHHVKLIPVFAYNPYSRGLQAESRLLFYIR